MAISPSPLLDSDAIHSVGRVLPWLARIPNGPDRGRFTTESLLRPSKRETRNAVAELERNLGERCKSIDPAVFTMMDKLRAEVEAAPPGTVMDPDGAGVQVFEETEAYFCSECDELRAIRGGLERSGGPGEHGKGIFHELDRLEDLLSQIVRRCQDIRWRLMINDGALAPTTGRTFASGAELVSSLTRD